MYNLNRIVALGLTLWVATPTAAFDCASSPCDTNALCTDLAPSGFQCTCNSGYEGDGFTCQDIDECNLDPDICGSNAVCVNTDGSYACNCNSGYEASGLGGGGDPCQDIDECSENTHNCDAYAICTNLEGSYQCTCENGFQGDGFTCMDIDECATGTYCTGSGESCSNIPGGYVCYCSSGCTGDGNGGCTDVDECAIGSDQCDHNYHGNCINLEGTYDCFCDDGFDGDGFQCIDINECLSSSSCHADATCTNTEGSFICTCNAGFDGDGQSCTATVAPTTPQPTTTSAPSQAPTQVPTNLRPSPTDAPVSRPPAWGGGGWGGCFSGSTTVEVLKRGPVRMEDLQVGDAVLTAKNKYQPIYTFGHRDEETEETFYQIYHDNSKEEEDEPIEMTGNHLVFVLDSQSGKQRAIRADELQVWDQLVIVSDDDDHDDDAQEASTVQVSRIETVQKTGVYMPLTVSGTIVVQDGIVASNYVSIQRETPSLIDSAMLFPFGGIDEHMLSHWWMSPYRLFCSGVYFHFCGDGQQNETTHDGSGILKWLVLGRHLAGITERYAVVLHSSFVSVPTFLFFGLCNLLEFVVFGPVWLPLSIGMVLLAFLVYFYHKYNEI